jgi:hypothetical protein
MASICRFLKFVTECHSKRTLGCPQLRDVTLRDEEYVVEETCVIATTGYKRETEAEIAIQKETKDAKKKETETETENEETTEIGNWTETHEIGIREQAVKDLMTEVVAIVREDFLAVMIGGIDE